MRLFILALTIPALASVATAQPGHYDWTISASATDPFVNDVSAQGLQTFYLWLSCSESAVVNGASAAEFSIVSTGVVHLDTIMRPGFVNAGSTSELLLTLAGCPSGPVVVADLLVISLFGSIGLGPSGNALLATVDCCSPFQVHPMDWKGIGVGGVTAPQSGELGCNLIAHCPILICEYGMCVLTDCCCPPCPEPVNCIEGKPCVVVSVERSHWGWVKSRYR